MLPMQLDIPAARYAFAYIANSDIRKSERDLSHIELERSDNISSASGWGSQKRVLRVFGVRSKARTYRVNKVDISTKTKNGHLLKCPLAFIVLHYGSRAKKIRSKSLDR